MYQKIHSEAMGKKLWAENNILFVDQMRNPANLKVHEEKAIAKHWLQQRILRGKMKLDRLHRIKNDKPRRKTRREAALSHMSEADQIRKDIEAGFENLRKILLSQGIQPSF